MDEWISVGDRLPESDDEVLVCEGCCECYCENSTLFLGYYDVGANMWYESMNMGTIAATHWMSTPRRCEHFKG